MAIKVKLKKKDEGGDAEDVTGAESPELLDAEDAGDAAPSPAGPAPAGSQALDDLLERDLFLETADKSVGWAAQNQTALIAIFAILAAVIVGVVIWQNQSESTTAEHSASLTAAVDILQAPIEGQEPPNPLAPEKDKKAPKLTFKTAQEKYTALGAKADEAQAAVKGTPAEGTATLLKARAALGTGKVDEAIGLYQGWLSSHATAPERAFVLQALGEAQVQAGKPAEAAATFEQLKGLDEKAWGEYAAFQTAVAYDVAADKDKARASYEAFVKGYPESDRVAQARLRLDLL